MVSSFIEILIFESGPGYGQGRKRRLQLSPTTISWFIHFVHLEMIVIHMFRVKFVDGKCSTCLLSILLLLKVEITTYSYPWI